MGFSVFINLHVEEILVFKLFRQQITTREGIQVFWGFFCEIWSFLINFVLLLLGFIWFGQFFKLIRWKIIKQSIWIYWAEWVRWFSLAYCGLFLPLLSFEIFNVFLEFFIVSKSLRLIKICFALSLDILIKVLQAIFLGGG